MSKDDKYEGVPKVADLKKIDVENKPKSKHHKKAYPPHWEVRDNWIHSKKLKSDTKWHNVITRQNGYVCYVQSDEYRNVHDFLSVGRLDDALAIYTKYHPETAEWPVRFINIQPMETKREILK